MRDLEGTIRCPRCEATNSGGAFYCHVCGAALKAAPAGAVRPSPGPSAEEIMKTLHGADAPPRTLPAGGISAAEINSALREGSTSAFRSSSVPSASVFSGASASAHAPYAYAEPPSTGPAWLALLGGIGAVAGALLPWISVNLSYTDSNGFTVNNGLSFNGLSGFITTGWWPLILGLVAAALALATLSRPAGLGRALGAVELAIGGVLGAVSGQEFDGLTQLGLRWTQDTSLISIGPGPYCMAAGAVALGLAGLWHLASVE